jgi:hypothetical protein
MLDDAIRDHLELKRRRGADPGEVDREQAEALAPVSDPEREADGGTEADYPPDAGRASETGTAVSGELHADAGDELPETAELDMERALRADAESEHGVEAQLHDGLEGGSPAWHDPEDFELPSAEGPPVDRQPAGDETEAPAESLHAGSAQEQANPPQLG